MTTKESITMKKIWIALLLVLSLVTVCLAAEKVEAPDSCKHCGMNRTKFSHSRMVVTYADGSTGTCSINCVVIDMKETKKEVTSFQVGDYNSKKLINAKTATWVIGGSKKGVMTPVAKWAFAEKKDAEAFIKKNGGKPATFDDMVKATENELAERDAPKEHKGHGDHKM
jgi:nitrous oxide reductase accessory protein NosL